MKKYTEDELQKSWIYRCEECGATGLSKDLINTDAFDVCCYCCPKCFANEYSIKDYEEKESLKNRVKWFFRFITFYRLRRSEFLYNLKMKIMEPILHFKISRLGKSNMQNENTTD